MRQRTPGSAVAGLLAGCLLLAGCGGSSQALPKDPFSYDAAQPLAVRVVGAETSGRVDVRTLSYAAADGTRVPALFAIPRRSKVAGCLIYQPGLLPKDAAAPLWPSAARLGLAVFTIDPRDTGARTNALAPLGQALASPQGLISFLRGDVIDLRRGLDYLEGQASCHRNVGYLGIGGGADFGVLLAGADARIRVAVLCSIGATWRSELFYSASALLDLAGDPGELRTAVAELSPLNPAAWIGKISPRPVMIADGLADSTIPPVDALNLAAAAREPKVALLYDGGDQPFAGPAGKAVSAQVNAFLKKNLADDGVGS